MVTVSTGSSFEIGDRLHYGGHTIVRKAVNRWDHNGFAFTDDHVRGIVLAGYGRVTRDKHLEGSWVKYGSAMYPIHYGRTGVPCVEMLGVTYRVERLLEDGWKIVQSEVKTVPCTFDSFVERMKIELEANAHKGDQGSWANVSPEVLWNDMMYHAAKLIYAIKHGEAGKVEEFAADVANMAMMVRDAYAARIAAGITQGAES